MKAFVRPTVNLEPSAEEELRTLPELVKFHSLNNPDHLFCLQAQKNAIGDGHLFTELNYKQLEQAIIHCQIWLTVNIAEINISVRDEDSTITKCSPVALFMESNYGLAVYALSLMGLGIPVVLLSTRLSPLSVYHLLRTTCAKAVIVSPRLKHVISDALVSGRDYRATNQEGTYALNVKVYDAAAYDVFLSIGKERLDGNITHSHHYVSESDKNVLILHSSGTTGLPKPIYCSHRHLLGFTRCHEFTSDEVAQGLAISTSPFFHVSFQILQLGIV